MSIFQYRKTARAKETFAHICCSLLLSKGAIQDVSKIISTACPGVLNSVDISTLVSFDFFSLGIAYSL